MQTLYVDAYAAGKAVERNVARCTYGGRLVMKKVELPIPELALIAATRGMLGAGVGLLLAGRLSEHKRTVVGRILVAIGALSTIPLAIDLVRRRRKA